MVEAKVTSIEENIILTEYQVPQIFATSWFGTPWFILIYFFQITLYLPLVTNDALPLLLIGIL